MGFTQPRLFRATTLVALLACGRSAHAMEPPPDGATLEEVRAYEDRLRPFTLLGDALVVLTGHMSIEAQVVPWMHHAFRLNPFCTVSDPSLPFISTSTGNGFQLSCGSEVGYRYYTGQRGANGFFAGPSLILGHTHVNAGVDSQRAQPIAAIDLLYGAAAIDIGVQGIHESGLTVGGGAGFLVVHRLDAGSSLGRDLRIFIDVGYSFP